VTVLTAGEASPRQQTRVAGQLLGPDMRQLRLRFPARTPPETWPATEQHRDRVLAKLLAPPFTLDDAEAQERRRRGLIGVVDWLAEQPGDTWQQRWQASGAEALGNADWWRPWLPRLQSGSQRRGQSVSITSNLRVCLLVLICAEVIRPGLGWLLHPRTPQNLVADLARTRDPDGFAELTALSQAFPAGRTMTMAAMRRVATIVAAKGGTVHDITVGDCLELSLALDGDPRRKNKGLGFYQLLHQMGVFGPKAPSTLRAFATQGQLSPAQMLEPYAIECAPIRDLLLAYLHERQPTLDHTSLRSLASTLGRLFWRDLELHHPGINSLSLAPEVTAAWKQRVLTRIVRTTGADGQVIEEQRHRADGHSQLALVRAFYLDLAQWAMEEPARWGPWAAPCPVRREDLTRTKELRRRKSRMDQRTRERLPVLPALIARVQDERLASAACLVAAKATVPGDSFTHDGRLQRRVSGTSTARVWVEDPGTRTRVDLSGLEDRAFWTWAAVETLRHTGIRVEELTELSHHSLIQYTLPTNRELIPLLQIAPSKTDTERLLVISPELADVLAAVIHRIRARDGAVPCVTSYDPHERRWNPPLPLLFQRQFGMSTRAIPAGTLRDWICRALDGSGIADVAGQPLRFTPHDFRRLFITDAVLHGMPPHIAQLVAGHRDINTTMGYKAVYPEEVINGHRAFIARRRALRPSEEYRAPTDAEWQEFLGHFERRKVALGTCGRSYSTGCIHEHSCLRCPLLRPDPTSRRRIEEIRDNLHARIDEARREGWLGEVDGLQISLAGARQKLAQLAQLAAQRTINLGMPSFTSIVGRITQNTTNF
jgi:Phage integrase family